MRLLATGGAGYIGSHTVLDLLQAGHEVSVLDDLSRGHAEALSRVEQLSGRSVPLIRCDVGRIEASALQGMDAVVHFAAFKAVGESMERPELYFRNNLGGLARLLEAMAEAGVKRLVYSSSASVYGQQELLPIRERAALQPESPYGLTKLQGEQMLEWMAQRRGWSVVSLRYFNPVGAHASGRIGEPFEQGTNLFPRLLRAYASPSDPITVFGTDYDTPDGTCVRDYIHVVDLARAHRLALEQLRPGHARLNVGTGTGLSVREVLSAFEARTGRPVPAQDGPRRPGDPAAVVADATEMERVTGFRAEHGLEQMVDSAWAFWQANPQGYA